MIEAVPNLRDLKEGEPDLFTPATEFGATAINTEGVFKVARVPVTLRKVEGVAGVVRIGFKGALENVRILLISERVAGAGSVMMRDGGEAGEKLLGASVCAGDVFMEDAFVAPWKRVPHQLAAQIADASVAHEQVEGVDAQIGQSEAGLDLENFIGIDDEDVVGAAVREAESFAAVVGEIHPGTFVQLPGNVR